MHPEPAERDTVAGLGEFGLIERITAGRPQSDATLLGPGDDAAVVAASDGRVVASTDILVEGVHFRLDWSNPHQIGRKSIAVNLADIAAMGATPTGLLVGMACPSDTPTEVVDGLSAGMWEEAGSVGVGLVGGDMATAHQIMISVTALGDLMGRPAVTRSGARPGDVVAVCGRLGWAAAGLAVLGRGFRSPGAVVAAQRVPTPPYAAGPEAADAGATAMIDVSDGLLADLGHIAEASAVSIDVWSDRLEVHQRLVDVASALGADPLHWVLTGGEDHALAATFPAEAVLPAEWRAIGTVNTGSLITVDGRIYDGPTGWEHWRHPG
ncbi:thiamine-phosphate kinase [Actinoalloteichus hymeniacidonis]|uniref:Thiamine-monophosphate kinase n=1 Tax=Actinoalloteichus hymeniacidonis TaxID=340345 RepID=A0AAC9MZD7_9PSEU|nr:thiamine-phosphate kinase [Actinoalloteichus hymeniacidonis]AOS65293.1 thiamine-phosphate kinase [Actinoalloteichus hymeniacidonis]MBB5906623.1 thiamine-monophosphate kinase [Actinoalloteichus hymeniacidonis]